MEQSQLRVGIVGLGRAGWSIHVNTLRARSDVRIVAVSDQLASRRAQAQAELGCATYTTLGRLLKGESSLDVVVIATPSHRHASDTKKVLAAGRHVVVEKPMAMSVAQADGMIRAADQAGRKLFVHQNYRFEPLFAHLQEVIASGILGRVFHIRNVAVKFERRNDWQTLARNGGGVLNNTCPHNLDNIMELMGAPVVDVMGDLQQIASPGDVEDHVKVLLRAANGCTADLEVSSVQNVAAVLPQWTICGSCGTLTSDGTTSTIRYFDPAEAPPIEVIDGPVAQRLYGNDDVLPWRQKVVPSVGPDRGDFYDNVTGVLLRGEPMRITPQDVRERLRVMAAIRKGTKFPGRPVTGSPKSGC